MSQGRRFECIVLTLFMAGCNGFISDAGEGPGAGAPAAPDGDPPVSELRCEGDAVSVGETPLRRLTTEQYQNTVRDLLAIDTLHPDARRTLSLIPDGRVDYFASSTQAPDAENVRAYLLLAEVLAGQVREAGFDGLVSCDHTDASCVRAFVESFGRRAFRRPLSEIDPDLVDTYVAIHREELEATDADTALETLVAAFLLSPHFLYHAETADADAAIGELAPLDGHSVASRLSFLIWAAGPDEALLDAAAAGELDTAEGVEAHARALLDDPRARQGIRSFHDQWMRLSEVRDLVRDDPMWRDGMGETMREEALRFAEHVVLEGEGTVAELLTASYSFPGEGVAEIYGGAPTGAPFSRVELDPETRAGILTQPALMAQFGTIFPEVHRGLFVREQLLCDSLPPPPPGVADLPVEDRTVTEPCNGCHLAMDPIGFGFAGYDALGRFDPARARSGEIVETGGVPASSPVTGTFETIPELAERLARSPEVERCITVQWVRYATGREVEAADSCGIERLEAALRESGGDVRELLVAIATSEGFRSRHVSELR